MALTTASAKAKGRRLQDLVRNSLRAIGTKHGLEDDDVKSQIMGVSGVDIVMSPAAKKVFGDLALECKNVEKLNTISVFHQHAAKYPKSTPLLIHKKNKTEPLCTMKLSDYLVMLERLINVN